MSRRAERSNNGFSDAFFGRLSAKSGHYTKNKSVPFSAQTWSNTGARMQACKAITAPAPCAKPGATTKVKPLPPSTALLTRAYGHVSEWQTLENLCIQPEEIEEFYGWVL